jgi:hypothetical protein
MKRFLAYRSCFALASLPMACLGQATIEGTVQLPKTHFAPVENERYEIVSKAGVLATDPPRAVVYLIGNFLDLPTCPPKSWLRRTRFPASAARDRGWHEGGVPE